MKTAVIAIFDVGKTNKKILLFDEQYHLVHEEVCQLAETVDEDGDPCEDVIALTRWVIESYERLKSNEKFSIKALNISAYGASFVHTDSRLKPLLPLYNYLKTYPESLLENFYEQYDGKISFATQCASPVLGSLNSGMQIYRILKQKPQTFQSLRYCLHLPQYLSAILTHDPCSEITSIGCHTNLWNFTTNNYHPWVSAEKVIEKFPAVQSGEYVHRREIIFGVGLHDSSAALIPYLASFKEPFMLLSTGTWCISMNPFNNTPLTENELANDCLCYLSFHGRPVKASRLFSGHEHDVQVRRIALHFGVSENDVQDTVCTEQEINNMATEISQNIDDLKFKFQMKSLSDFQSHRDAYRALMTDLVSRQVFSSHLVLKGSDVKNIFVDGGFSRNKLFMNLLTILFPEYKVYAATVPQASALGAALAIHYHWNNKPAPKTLVQLK